MEEELRSHLDLLADRNEREGIERDAALRAARVELGSLDSVREAVRDVRFGSVAEDLWKDLVHGARMLVKAPAYALVAVLTLALGIGATTAIFSVVHAVLIQPLPYDEPGRLVLVWSNFSGMGARRAPGSPFQFREIAERSRAFDSLAGIWVGSGTLTGEGEPEQLKVGFCMWSFFDVLGTRPLLGRSFRHSDARQRQTGTIILSHGVWQRRFGADQGILGRAIRFEGGSATVAGVMPAGLHVLGFVFGVSLFTGLLFGLAPGIFTCRVNPSRALQESTRGSTAAGRQRFRSALVVSEVALGFVLLIGAGLTVRSLAALQEVNPGFRPERVVTFEVNLPPSRYPTDLERRRFARSFAEELARLPGVEAQGAISHLPLDDFPNWYSPYAPLGVSEQESRGLLADHRTATSGYLRAMGAELVAGRLFEERDDERQRNVVIVDDLLAQKQWPGRSAVGQRIRHEFFENGRFLPREAEVVGVVRNMRHHGLQIQLREQIYIPYPQSPRPRLSFAVSGSLLLLRGIGQALHGLDKDLALSKARPMQWYVHRATTASRFTTILASMFGGLALLLALVGIFGVVSYSVGQRAQEIAVRMALGARPIDVLIMVVSEGLGLTLAGLLFGLGAALYCTRFVGSLLYGVSPLDPATYIVVFLLLPACAALASGIPANRAARLNPVESLQRQ